VSGTLRPAAIALVALLAPAGCGAERPPLPPACINAQEDLLTALQAVPDPVALPDGTRLSACVQLAFTPSDLQSFGVLANGVADDLAARAQQGDGRAALQLGYLIGAAREGASRTDGVQLELARTLEQATALPGIAPAARAQAERGVALGEATG
jgi:hypothetical protein